jgi:hypothetical protein
MLQKETNTKDLIVPAITKQSLALKVETYVRQDGLTYVEAILQVCDELDIDPEDIAKMVAGPLRDKVEAEAQRTNVLPKPASLFD